MDVILGLHPKDKTKNLKSHIRDAIVNRNHNFISTYYNQGFDMSIKLYERGKNTAGTGDSGMIEHAISMEVPDMVNFLLECDVPILDPANNSNSPIEYAVETYDLNLIKSILKSGVDPNIICNYYYEPFIPFYDEPWSHIFLNKGFYKGFEEFWKKGLNPNIKDKTNNNLLHTMLLNDYDFTIKASDILNKISNINEENSYGETALFIACKTGNIKLVKKILSKNANVNIGNNQKVTPLMIAAYTNNIELLKILIKEKSNNNDIDDQNRTALDYAKMGNAKEAIQLLKQ